MPYIGLLDVAGIQDFVFRTSRMREFTRASQEVEDLTRPDGLFETAARGTGAALRIAAGGNAVYVAGTRADIEQVFRTVSGTLLREYPGLEVRGVIEEYGADRLAAEGYGAALRTLEKAKFTQPRPIEFAFPGLKQDEPAALGAWAQPDANGLIYPANLDDMIVKSTFDGGHKEQAGLMAVVCVDGLGMGRKLIDWLGKQRDEGPSDEDFLLDFARWSEYIKKRWQQAWEGAVAHLDERFSRDFTWHASGPRPRRLELKADAKTSAHVRPVRRIYQGGDDLTFVCDARIAMAFTVDLARRLERAPEPAEAEGIEKRFQRLAVSIGVVFVDAHFPFSRAVHMAEDVRASAKQAAIDADADHPPSVIDWWVNREGALSRTPRGHTVKPCGVDAGSTAGEVSWQQLEGTVLRGMARQYSGARNKLKDLMEAAEEGPDAVRELLVRRPVEGSPALRFVPAGFDRETGFAKGGRERTPVLDAGELYDIHVPYEDWHDPKEEQPCADD